MDILVLFKVHFSHHILSRRDQCPYISLCSHRIRRKSSSFQNLLFKELTRQKLLDVRPSQFYYDIISAVPFQIDCFVKMPTRKLFCSLDQLTPANLVPSMLDHPLTDSMKELIRRAKIMLDNENMAHQEHQYLPPLPDVLQPVDIYGEIPVVNDEDFYVDNEPQAMPVPGTRAWMDYYYPPVPRR